MSAPSRSRLSSVHRLSSPRRMSSSPSPSPPLVYRLTSPTGRLFSPKPVPHLPDGDAPGPPLVGQRHDQLGVLVKNVGEHDVRIGRGHAVRVETPNRSSWATSSPRTERTCRTAAAIASREVPDIAQTLAAGTEPILTVHPGSRRMRSRPRSDGRAVCPGAGTHRDVQARVSSEMPEASAMPGHLRRLSR